MTDAMVLNIGTGTFETLSNEEMQRVDGGVVFAIGLATVLFKVGQISVTVGMCLKAGAAVGLVAGGAVALSN